MTALRYTHRQVDWRKLNIDHSRRPRRCHDRTIYGPLVPMDTEQSWPGWLKVLVAVLAVPAVLLLIAK